MSGGVYSLRVGRSRPRGGGVRQGRSRPRARGCLAQITLKAIAQQRGMNLIVDSQNAFADQLVGLRFVLRRSAHAMCGGKQHEIGESESVERGYERGADGY